MFVPLQRTVALTSVIRRFQTLHKEIQTLRETVSWGRPFQVKCSAASERPVCGSCCSNAYEARDGVCVCGGGQQSTSQSVFVENLQNIFSAVSSVFASFDEISASGSRTHLRKRFGGATA